MDAVGYRCGKRPAYRQAPRSKATARAPSTWLHLLALAILCLYLAGCAVKPYQEPSVLLADAHGGAGSLAISRDSRLLGSGSWSGRISIWRLSDGDHLRSWTAHRGDVTGLTYLDDNRLLSAGYDGYLKVWSSAGQKVGGVDSGSPITAVAADPQRQWLLTGHVDGGLRLWSVSDLSMVQVLGKHDGRIRAAAIAPDGEIFASSAVDGKVKIWRRDGSVTELPEPGSDARTLVFSHHGDLLYGGGWFDLYRWDLPSARLATLDTEHRGIINSIQFDPRGRYLASISRQTDSAVLMLDPSSGQTLRRFQPHKLCGGVVVISPDGGTMATTSDDASVMIWHLEQRESAAIDAPLSR